MPFGTIIQRRTPTLFAGRLRHKIDLVQVSNVQDTTGGFDINANVVYANVWASVEAITGTEKLAASELISEASHQVVIRFIGAAPSWQALFNYPGAALAKDSNGNLEQAQSGGGTSGATAPTWNTTVGGFTQDGDPSTGVVWKNLGPAPARTGVTADMQVWFQGRQFQITSVLNPDERTKMLVLLCVELNDSRQQITNQPGGLN